MTVGQSDGWLHRPAATLLVGVLALAAGAVGAVQWIREQSEVARLIGLSAVSRVMGMLSSGYEDGERRPPGADHHGGCGRSQEFTITMPVIEPWMPHT